MKLRVVIADDEPPARELLATLLAREAGVELVGLAADGAEALEVIRAQTPQLVFLDIQMPGLDGFGVLAALPPESLPLIVFVTAFSEHAVRAFEAQALDYLLKPFEFDRVHQAVERARKALGNGAEAGYARRLLALLGDLRGGEDAWDRVAVRDGERTVFLRPEEIDWAEADGNYVKLHVGREVHLWRTPLHDAETRLGKSGFLRVNRSTLVNLDRVHAWEPMFHGDSTIVLRDGSRVTLTRTHRERFEEKVARLK
jgi:two-component system LytT family response regulator